LMLELYLGAKSKIRFVTQQEIYGRSYEDIPRRVPDNTKMRKLLGVEPKVSLKEGTAMAMEWFRREANA
jgi:UDP-glucose 4-epimerase